MLCTEACLVNTGWHKVRAVTLRCRAWSCDLCLPYRRGLLIKLAKSGEPNTLITLTAGPGAGPDPDARARALVDAWRVVVRRAKRRYGYRSIPYLCVFEATKNGEPHIHILARCKWIEQKWLSTEMADLIASPVVDIRRIKGASHVAHYVAKYIGKGPGKFGSCKRYWHTRDYPTKPKPRRRQDRSWDALWHIVEGRVPELALTYWMRSYQVEIEAQGHYFEGHKVARAPPAVALGLRA